MLLRVVTRERAEEVPMFNVSNRSTPRPNRLRPILALVALLGLLSACIVVPAYGPPRSHYYGHYWQ
jgi:hypothetical protein